MILQYLLILTLAINGLSDDMDITLNDPRQDDLYLVVVDMQLFDFKKAEVENSARELTGKINSLVDQFDPTKVIYIQTSSLVLSVSFKGIKVDTLAPPDLDPELKLVSDNLFTKAGGNAFTSNELNEFLEMHKVRKIALVGLIAEGCVYDTALGGLEKGYEMYIIPDAVIGKSEKKKEKALRKMQAGGIKVLAMDDIYQ